MELLIAAFTGFGSIVLGVVALRLQRLEDTRTLLWPELVRTHEAGADNLYTMNLRTVAGPVIGARFVLTTQNGAWGTGSIPLLETGESWDIWPAEARAAFGRGDAPPRVCTGCVWCPSRSNRRRWQARLVTSAVNGPDVRLSKTFWSRAAPSARDVLARFGVETDPEKFDVIATPAP